MQQPPNDLDAERQVLGAALVRPDLLVSLSATLTADDFYSIHHQTIYAALTNLYHEGDSGEIDSIRVIQHLRDRELLEKAGGDAFILRLSEDVVAPANATLHARRLKDISLRRQLMSAANSIAEEAAGAVMDQTQFLKTVEDKILSITNRSFTQGLMPVAELKPDFTAYLEELIKSKGQLKGQQTHFHEFDNLTGGLKGGELIVLAARPGMGKTTLAMNMAANVALQDRRNVIIYSLEMSRMELLMRLVCSTAQFNQSDLKRGNIPQNRVQDILTAVEHIFAAPINIDDTGTLNIWDCIVRTRRKAIELDQRGESLGLIVVDYLQLLTDPESRQQGRQNEVAAISRNLKQLAKYVNAPVLALSQMNRSVEQRRGDSRPQLSDLRESGAIEQDADIVMFIHQDQYGREQDELEMDLQRQEDKGTAEVILAKHRSGPIGSFRLAFRPEINRFDNAPKLDPSFAGA